MTGPRTGPRNGPGQEPGNGPASQRPNRPETARTQSKAQSKAQSRPAPDWSRVSPARRAAYAVLEQVAQTDAHSDELLHSPLTHSLSEVDRHLATALVMGVLRWELALDSQLVALLQRPDQQLSLPVILALRLGAFQLRYMDRIPPHAALSESVEICRAAGQDHATGLVNAVLRKLSNTPARKPGIVESPAAMAERLAHPEWLVQRWIRQYGRQAALQICEADQQEPARGQMFLPSDSEMPLLDDGSRLVAELAAAVAPEATCVWDCCAAPGGKTQVLAQRLPGAGILATDISPRRLRRMASRLPPETRIRCAVSDATNLNPEEGRFDLVLCDVPCSGTGTLGRNPEIRLRLTPEDLPRQVERQRRILAAALARVAPGGRLVYSTCSLEPEECESVVDAEGSGWQRVPLDGISIPGLQGGLASMVRNDALRTLPGVHPCDGFFAVVLQRC